MLFVVWKCLFMIKCLKHLPVIAIIWAYNGSPRRKCIWKYLYVFIAFSYLIPLQVVVLLVLMPWNIAKFSFPTSFHTSWPKTLGLWWFLTDVQFLSIVVDTFSLMHIVWLILLSCWWAWSLVSVRIDCLDLIDLMRNRWCLIANLNLQLDHCLDFGQHSRCHHQHVK